MWDWLFGGGAAWFTVPAIVGTAFFVLQLTFMMIGVDHDVGDVDLTLDHGDASLHAFKVLSLQSIATFLMGFGWGAFWAMRSFTDSHMVATLVGAGIGALFVWILGIALKAMYDLQTSGNIEPSRAVGLTGDVDVGIPGQGQGTGTVRLIVDQRLRTYNARTEGEEIARGQRIKVTAVTGSTLTVVRE